MRDLGRGQTLTFYISYEIEADIYRVLELGPNVSITAEHVLTWSMKQTMNNLKKLMPSCAKQGQKYLYHRHIWHRIYKTGRMNIKEGFRDQFVLKSKSSV